MQTKRREWMIGAIVCSLLVALPGSLLAAQAPEGEGAGGPAKPVKPAPPKDPVAVLKAIPASATAFVAVRNIAEVDYDVADVLAKLELPLDQLGFPGLITILKEQVGIEEGLEVNSGAAVVLLDCTEVKTLDDVDKRAVILVPTDKPEALVKALGGGEKEGDAYKLTLGSEPAIATEKDGFLVIASAEATDAIKEVVQVKEGIDKAMAPDRLKAYGDADIFAWASMRRISKELRAEPVKTLKGMMMAGSPEAKPEEVDASLAEINKFLDELKEVSLSLTLDARIGLKGTFWYQAMPDSGIARRLAAVKPGDGSLLVGLPDEPMIAAAGWLNTIREEDIQKTVDQLLKPEILGGDVDEEQIKSVKDSLVKLATSFEQAAVSVTGLPSESEDGLIGVTAVAKVANSQQTQAEIRKLFTSAKDMLVKTALNKGDLTEEESKTINEAIQLKEDAEKLTGAAVDHFVVDLAKIPDVEEEQLEQIKSVIGQEGIVIRIASIGERNVAITFGGGARRFAQVVEMVQKNQAPLAERKAIKMVANRLPGTKRIGEGYLSVDRLLATVMDVFAKTGQMMPFPLNMKETAPLSVMASQIDPTTAEVNVLVPIELAQSTAEMVKPMMMMFMGGMGEPGATMPEEEEEKEETAPPNTPGVR